MFEASSSSLNIHPPRFFKPMLKVGVQSRLMEGDLIKVTVLGAEGITSKRSFNGYCSIRSNIFPRNTSVKYWNEDRISVSLHTKLIKDCGSEPRWNETFEFFIDEEQVLTEVNLCLKMEVLSKNTVLLDDSFGVTSVDIDPEKYAIGKDHKVQLYLSKEGSINVLIRIDRNPQYTPKGTCFNAPTENQL